MKQKAKIYKRRRIVIGDKNLVTKNEIHVNDICKDTGGCADEESKSLKYYQTADMPINVLNALYSASSLVKSESYDNQFEINTPITPNKFYITALAVDSSLLISDYNDLTNTVPILWEITEDLTPYEITKEEFYSQSHYKEKDITFTIDDTVFHAKQGMTWIGFLELVPHGEGFMIHDNYRIFTFKGKVVMGEGRVTICDEFIIPNLKYKSGYQFEG